MNSVDIAIIGSGVVGTATGSGFIQKGHRVVFIDINPHRLAELESRGFNIHNAHDPLHFSARFIFVCINTPYHNGAIDLSYIEGSMSLVGQLIAQQKQRSNVVIRSTVLPGTTEKRLAPLIEKYSGQKQGDGFTLSHNPEFLRAASAEQDFMHPRATVLGVARDSELKDDLRHLFTPFSKEISFLTIQQAEYVKYISNLRNSTLISFANEMWLLGQHLGIDVAPCLDVISAVSETIWNPSYASTGGSPYGGTCFPKDTKSLLAMAKADNVPMPLLEATIHVNETMEKLAAEGKAQPAMIKGLNWKPMPDTEE